MRALHERMVMVLTVLFIALSLAQSGQTSLLIASIATVALASTLAIRYAAVEVGSREMTVGARAHAHREALSRMPAPAHPSTAARSCTMSIIFSVRSLVPHHRLAVRVPREGRGNDSGIS